MQFVGFDPTVCLRLRLCSLSLLVFGAIQFADGIKYNQGKQGSEGERQLNCHYDWDETL